MEKTKLQKKIIHWKDELKGHEGAMKKQTEIYRSIMAQTKKRGFAKNPLFRAAYCYFYDIKIWKNDDVLTKWINKYFDRMGEIYLKGAAQDEIGNIVLSLQIDGADETQLSFASKLLHTCNPDLPIYDSNVWLALKGSLVGKTKIEKYMNLNLKRILDENKQVRNAVSDFGKEYGIRKDVKSLDFILWRIGKNLKDKKKR